LGIEFRQGQSLTQLTRDKLARIYTAAWTENLATTTTSASPSYTPPLENARPSTPSNPQSNNRRFSSMTPAGRSLTDAAANGNQAELERLLNAGADINSRDELGWTPLIAAAAEGQRGMVQWLLSKGADVNAKDKNGYSALTYAKSSGSKDLITLLKNAGAKP